MPINLVKKLTLTSLLVPVLSLTSTIVDSKPVNDDVINSTEVSATESTATESTEQQDNAKASLMATLSKLAFFSANFEQKILSDQGELLQQGTGTLAISKPNLVNWQTVTPDETLIVSDGNTLWFYDPFIEQASAYSLATSIHNTPILLLTSDEPSLWQQYQVTKLAKDKQEQGFVITPVDKNSQIKRLTLTFTTADVADKNDSQLKQFSFQDATGQVSQIHLSNFNSKTKPSAALFNFTLPQGVRLEDKR